MITQTLNLKKIWIDLRNEGEHNSIQQLPALDSMNEVGAKIFGHAFSYSIAIEHPAIDIWKGKEAYETKAQKSIYHSAKYNAAARHREFDPLIEKGDTWTK